MKKYIISLFLLLSVNIVYSQKISNLSPTMLVWRSNNNKISLSQARYGVNIKDSLSLDVYFSSQLYNKFSKPNQSFEFRWYYYLSTKKRLMCIDKIDNIQKQKDGSVFVHSSQYNMQPGWWEVQIVVGSDNGLLQIANTSKFQILMKK